MQNPFRVFHFWITVVFLLLSIRCASPEVEAPTVVPAASEPAALNDQAAQRLTTYFDNLARSGRFNGVVLAASNDSLYTLARGLRNFESGDSLREDDVFQLGSVSKPLTAYAFLILMEQQRWSPEMLVSDVLPEFPYPSITLAMLLSHQSGIGNYTYVTDSLWGMPDSFMTNCDLECMLMAKEVPEYYRPGTTFNYCNTNYALLATIIEYATGKSFGDFVDTELFEPLQMEASFIVDPFKRTPDDMVVRGHYPNGKLKRSLYLDGVVGDKGTYSNTADLLKFYKELKNPTLVSEPLVARALSPQTKRKKGSFYGYGFRVKEIAGDTIVFHNGWWRGFRAYFWMSATHDKLFIGLSNHVKGRYLKQDEIWNLF